jgi:hypothetical protein
VAKARIRYVRLPCSAGARTSLAEFRLSTIPAVWARAYPHRAGGEHEPGVSPPAVAASGLDRIPGRPGADLVCVRGTWVPLYGTEVPRPSLPPARERRHRCRCYEGNQRRGGSAPRLRRVPQPRAPPARRLRASRPPPALGSAR